MWTSLTEGQENLYNLESERGEKDCRYKKPIFLGKTIHYEWEELKDDNDNG